MVKQYPHTLVVNSVASSYQDSNGDWTGGTNQSVQYRCRAEFLRGGGFVQNADGMDTNFNWLVWMPLTDDVIPAGAKVQVKDESNNAIIDSAVVRFLKGQLNVRVWL